MSAVETPAVFDSSKSRKCWRTCRDNYIPARSKVNSRKVSRSSYESQS